jgi:hypothetical protein
MGVVLRIGFADLIFKGNRVQPYQSAVNEGAESEVPIAMRSEELILKTLINRLA